jgi:hypothetical protein
VELTAQAVLLGILLGQPLLGGKRAAGVVLALAAGAALAAPTLGWMASLLQGSARAGGFGVDVALAHSLHPIGLLQVVVGGLFGDLSRLPDRWWGQNYFPRGFPYFLSLYLGSVPVALAILASVRGDGIRRRLGLLSLLALLACLGRWAGLAVLAQAVPFLRTFRYPSKAFLTVHLGVALLVALGFRDLGPGNERRWRGVALLLLAAGIPLALGPFLSSLAPRTFRWLVQGFFAPGTAWPERLENARYVLADSSVAGIVAIAGSLLAGLAAIGRLRPLLAQSALLALLAADLLRNGAGLNPMASLAFYRLSPEMSAVASSIRAEGSRVFSFDPGESEAYWKARAARPGDHALWSFAMLAETLTPMTNVSQAVPSALSPDLTMLVPSDRTLPPELSRASAFPAIRERLRGAGVGRVLSLDPIDAPGLRVTAVVEPARASPLAVRVYALDDSLPLRFADGGRVTSLVETPIRIDARIEADRPTSFVVRDAWATGWSATVNGGETPLTRTSDGHRAVAVPAGTSRVQMRYRPPGVAAALLVSVGTALALLAAWRRSVPSPPREEPSA